MSDPSVFDGRPLVGDVIAGKYRIESVAGEGGMGIVYEAEHVILRQRVAVKVLRPGMMTTAEAAERFSVEAAAIARITSEHVVRVMDAGSLATGAPYLVMEYLEGCDLDRLLAERGVLDPAEVVDYALQALEALAHAHAAGAIHRDLKPANLFLATCPDGRRIIKLLDFGVAMAVDLSAEPEAGGEAVSGSPAYMSPEQLKNGPLDARSDLWSLGVVMYELLSGASPFGGTFSELITAILEGTPAPLSTRTRTLSPELARIVMKCLAPDPAARWSTSAELARALAPHGSGAWSGAIERIDHALAHVTPGRAPRRFATFENALQALEADHAASERVATSKPIVITVPRDSAGSTLRSAEAFFQTIPAPPSGDSISTRPPPGRPPALRILLVDDSAISLELHQDALTKAGFDVRATSSVAEFDELLTSWKPHLVLMDVQMPGVSGDELCRRVKAKFRATVPVVLMSALRREQLAGRAQVGGADAFFQKTNDWAAFVGFVKNICALTYSPESLPDAISDEVP